MAAVSTSALIDSTEHVTPDLLRFGWASAAIDAHPGLVTEWADHPDTAIRRAVMRSPHLTDAAAELVVATRQSGMHTLGSNPLTPVELLAGRSGALRRRRAIEQAGADDLDRVTGAPNQERYLELCSPTIDLVLARSPALDERTAVALARRSSRAIDPWVAALLVDRFGDVLDRALRRSMRGERLRATGRLVEVWTVSDTASSGTRRIGTSRGANMPSKSSNVKNEKQYEALKDKGMSKQRAAKIANSPDASKNGGKKSHSGLGKSNQGGTTAQHKAAGKKGGKAAAKSKKK